MRITLKHMDVALDSAAEVLAAGDRALSRFKAIWQTARGHEDRLGILAARSQLLDYLAAAHMLGDTHRYSAACDALLEQAWAFVERFQPANEILLVELSLALTAKRRPLARALAKAVLSGVVNGGLTLDSFQARSLAALLDLDYPVAQNIAAALTEACEGKAFDKVTCAQGLLWAKAVQQVVSGDGAAAERAIQELQQQHISSTDRELAKLKRGGASAFAPFDILDLPSAALISLIEAIGHASQPFSEAAQACGYALGLKSARAEG